jgi:hypothetical protein
MIIKILFSILLINFSQAEVTRIETVSAVSDSWDRQRLQIMERLSRQPNYSFGPNCWNSALLVSGLATSIRYTSDHEFWHWMDSSYCRELDDDEELQMGDIGSVYTGGSDIHYHSFMRINDNENFEKGSPAVESRWGTHPFENIVYPEYRDVIQRCRGNRSAQIRNNCPTRIRYHRCQPAPENIYSRHQELRVIEREVISIERSLSRWMTTENPSRADLETFITNFRRLDTLLSLINSLSFNGEKEFARVALGYRISGLLFTDNGQTTNPEIHNYRINGSNFINRAGGS